MQNITGSHELDAVVAHTRNADMRDRIANAITAPSEAYGPLTAYSGYSGYHGDN